MEDVGDTFSSFAQKFALKKTKESWSRIPVGAFLTALLIGGVAGCGSLWWWYHGQLSDRDAKVTEANERSDRNSREANGRADRQIGDARAGEERFKKLYELDEQIIGRMKDETQRLTADRDGLRSRLQESKTTIASLRAKIQEESDNKRLSEAELLVKQLNESLSTDGSGLQTGSAKAFGAGNKFTVLAGEAGETGCRLTISHVKSRIKQQQYSFRPGDSASFQFENMRIQFTFEFKGGAVGDDGAVINGNNCYFAVSQQ